MNEDDEGCGDDECLDEDLEDKQELLRALASGEPLLIPRAQRLRETRPRLFDPDDPSGSGSTTSEGDGKEADQNG